MNVSPKRKCAKSVLFPFALIFIQETHFFFSFNLLKDMEFGNKQRKSSKDSSPLLTEKSASSSPFKYQDTNYVGITISEELPQNNKKQPSSSIPKLTANTIEQPSYSPIYQPSSPLSCPFSPTTVQLNSQEESNRSWSYPSFSQPILSSAFKRVSIHNELPISYHQRLRERKRYGVCSLLYNSLVD